MLTMGASHSLAAARQSSKLIMSLRFVEYSRMRPQPVQVRLQVWSGSSCNTMANFGVLRSLCLIMCLAIFAVSARGKRIGFSLIVRRIGQTLAWDAERYAPRQRATPGQISLETKTLRGTRFATC